MRTEWSGYVAQYLKDGEWIDLPRSRKATLEGAIDQCKAHSAGIVILMGVRIRGRPLRIVRRRIVTEDEIAKEPFTLVRKGDDQ